MSPNEFLVLGDMTKLLSSYSHCLAVMNLAESHCTVGITITSCRRETSSACLSEIPNISALAAFRILFKIRILCKRMHGTGDDYLTGNSPDSER